MNFRFQIDLFAFPLVFAFLLQKKNGGDTKYEAYYEKKEKVQLDVVDLQNISSVGAFYAGIGPFYSKHRILVPM